MAKDDGAVIIVNRVESREIMRCVTSVVGRAPMVACGLGKAVLSTYPEDGAP